VVTASFKVRVDITADGLLLSNTARAGSAQVWPFEGLPRLNHVDPLAALVLGQPDFTHNTFGVSATAMSYPTGVAIDPTTGKVFVADMYNSRVLRFASFSALSNGAAAEGVLGQADFTSGSPNRGGGVAANTLSGPIGIALDSSGRLWVADRFNSRVLRFDAAAGKANGADADGVLGQADFIHNSANRGGGVAANTLDYPIGVAVESSGRLWVADISNNRVVRFDAAAGKANGADAEGVLGQADFTSGSPNRGGGVAANTLYYPYGVTVDGSGRLWVADYYKNRVLRFDAAAGKANGANADGVLGQADFTSGSLNRGGDVAANTLDFPVGVALDYSGRLWVADGSNHRLLLFDAAAGKANGADADGVLGQADFIHGDANRGGGVAANTLDNPIGVAVASGRLWVADYNNNRVLAFGFRNLFLPMVLKN
jgi:DNA-binding beta-propeller fold protein YncE